jgi:hypothetical protein
VNVSEIIQRLLTLKLTIAVMMAEIGSTVSFGVLLVWLLRKEYTHCAGNALDMFAGLAACFMYCTNGTSKLRNIDNEIIFCPTSQHEKVDFSPRAGEMVHSHGRNDRRRTGIHPLDITPAITPYSFRFAFDLRSKPREQD